MPSLKKLIQSPPDIDKAMRWFDAQATNILNHGKIPFIIIGYDEEQTPGKIEIPKEEERTDLQRSKTHAMIGDIAKQGIFKTPGRIVRMADYDIDEAKALIVVWFERDCAQMGEPLRHGSRVVIDPFSGEQITIRASTIKFLKSETINFTEWLYATGADGGVKWGEPALKEYALYRQAQQ